MHIVIDIPEKWYRWAKFNDIANGSMVSKGILDAVGNGTPLPKGCGRIMDVDKIIKKMEEREERLKDNRSMYETACVETALDMFGETIIEADKAVSEDKE